MIVNYKELMSPGVTNENGSCDRILGLNQASDCSAKKMLFISQVANIIDMEHIITLDIGNVPTIDQTIMLIYVDENGDKVEEELVDGKQIVKKMNLSDGILSSDFKFSVFSSSNTNYCDFDVSLSEDLLSYFVLSKDATGNIQLENNWNVDGVSIVTGGYEWRLNGTLLPSTATSSWIVDSEIRRTGVIGENILEATLITGSKFKYTYMYDPSILDMLLTQDDVIVGTDIFYNIVPSAKQVQGIEYSLFKNNSKIVNDAFTDNINDTFQLVAFETANNDSSIQTFDRNAYDSYYYFIEKTIVESLNKISDILALGLDTVGANSIYNFANNSNSISIPLSKTKQPDGIYELEYSINKDERFLSVEYNPDNINTLPLEITYKNGEIEYVDRDLVHRQTDIPSMIDKTVKFVDEEQLFVASTVGDFQFNNVAIGDTSLMSDNNGWIRSTGTTTLTRTFLQTENLTQIEFDYYGELLTQGVDTGVSVEVFDVNDILVSSASIHLRNDDLSWTISTNGVSKNVNGILYHNRINLNLLNHMDIKKMVIKLNGSENNFSIKDFIISVIVSL